MINKNKKVKICTATKLISGVEGISSQISQTEKKNQTQIIITFQIKLLLINKLKRSRLYGVADEWANDQQRPLGKSQVKGHFLVLLRREERDKRWLLRHCGFLHCLTRHWWHASRRVSRLKQRPHMQLNGTWYDISNAMTADMLKHRQETKFFQQFHVSFAQF